MIAEILLVLAGHPSSLFSTVGQVDASYKHLLHPGEQQCLEGLARIAERYKRIKTFCAKQSQSSSSYICAMCAKLNEIGTRCARALSCTAGSRVKRESTSERTHGW